MSAYILLAFALSGEAFAGSARLDFGKYQPTPGLGRSFADTAVTAPPTHGWSSYSTAKKTWIIVGITVGVAGIAYAVSNHSSSHGGSSGGGGGY
jgi:hypothetical protein